MINSGAVTNYPVTAEDIPRAYRIIITTHLGLNAGGPAKSTDPYSSDPCSKRASARHITHYAYNLPSTLLPWLVYYSVNRKSCHIAAGSSISALPKPFWEIKKTDFNRDLIFGFRDYLECSTPDKDNSM